MINDIFCKIVKKEIPKEIIAEGDDWIAFEDIHPQAPVHILIVSKKHITGVEGADSSDSKLLGEILLASNVIANKMNLNGFRLIINSGEDSERGVEHLHIHLLGGKRLGAKIVN